MEFHWGSKLILSPHKTQVWASYLGAELCQNNDNLKQNVWILCISIIRYYVKHFFYILFFSSFSFLFIIVGSRYHNIPLYYHLWLFLIFNNHCCRNHFPRAAPWNRQDPNITLYFLWYYCEYHVRKSHFAVGIYIVLQMSLDYFSFS